MPCFLVIHVNVSVFDEVFAKLAHALRVFGGGAISDYAGPSARFKDLGL
jgi:NADPH-dependent curcumin reductase CurA